jgi:hypothetical protein
MTEDNITHTDMICVGLSLFPRAIRETLISNADFRAQHGLKSESKITFGKSGVTFTRSEIFRAIRMLLGRTLLDLAVTDTEGGQWKLYLERKDDLDRVVLVQDQRRLVLSDFWYLSPDQESRIVGFERAVLEVNFPASSVSKWKDLFAAGSLSDEDFDDFQSDLRGTPTQVAGIISVELRSELNSDVHTLVPDDPRYFARLIGEPDGDETLAAYVEGTAPKHIQQLIDWRPLEGLKLVLLLCAHSSISKLIDASKIEPEVMIELFDWLATRADRISQLGGIEFGLRHLDKHPKIEPVILKLVEQIRKEDPEEESSRLSLLSALIVFVDGELSRTQLLRGTSPFWRRLAAIAHASLMERQLIGSRVRLGECARLMRQQRGQYFYLQTLTDLRSEPRWMPDFVLGGQLKAEFVGRIFGAARENESKICSPELRALLMGEDADGIRALLEFPFPFLPGPLEGGVESILDMPNEIKLKIESQLSAETLNAGSFASLVNSALIFRVDQNFATLAAQALRRVKYQLREDGDNDRIFSLLSGLAIVSAVTRSSDLAEEVRILTRAVRRRGQAKIAAENAMRIGLMAAASHSDLGNWCKFMGDWLTEQSFEDLEKEAVLNLHSHIRRLVHIVPKLWETCAKADAACAALVGSH